MSLITSAAGFLPLTHSAEASPPTFSSLAKDHRILLIFSASSSDTSRQQQLKALDGHKEEAGDRNLVMVTVPGPAPSPLFQTLSKKDESAIRQRFQVKPVEFTMILIGKDGGEKHRWSSPANFETIRELIDAMPMRKDEMSRKASERQVVR